MTLFQNWQHQHQADVDVTILIALLGYTASEVAEGEAAMSYEDILEQFHDEIEIDL